MCRRTTWVRWINQMLVVNTMAKQGQSSALQCWISCNFCLWSPVITEFQTKFCCVFQMCFLRLLRPHILQHLAYWLGNAYWVKLNIVYCLYKLFLWCHRVKYFGLLLVVTIFFATKLTKAELPDWMDWILVGYVAFHVAVHLILSVSLTFLNYFCEEVIVFITLILN